MPSGCKGIGIRLFEFVTKTQFLLITNGTISSLLKGMTANVW